MIHFFIISGWGATPLFGPEFTFYVGEGFGEYPRAIVSQMAQLIHEDCSACEMEPDLNTNRFLFRVVHNGQKFEFIISADPQVIEVQVQPMSFEEWQKIAPFFQREIFDRLKKKFKPHSWQGAGHMNIGVSSFESASHLKNFIQFMFNHPEIGFVFGEADYDYLFARHILQTDDEVRKTIFERMGQFRIDEKKDDWSQKIAFLEMINEDYFLRSEFDDLDALPLNYRSPIFAKKFNALAFEQLGLKALARIEIRTVRPQQSIEDWILLQEFFKALIQFTVNHDEDLILDQKYQKNVGVNLEKMIKLLQKLNLDPNRFSKLIKKSHLKTWNSLQKTGMTFQCIDLFRSNH